MKRDKWNGEDWALLGTAFFFFSLIAFLYNFAGI